MSNPTTPTSQGWLVALWSAGVSYTPPGSPEGSPSPALPPEASHIRGRLPDGIEVTPTPQGSELRFHPPLPEGAQIILRDDHDHVQVLYEVKPRSLRPPIDDLPAWSPSDEPPPA